MGIEEACNKSSPSRMRFLGRTGGNSTRSSVCQPPLPGFGLATHWYKVPCRTWLFRQEGRSWRRRRGYWRYSGENVLLKSSGHGTYRSPAPPPTQQGPHEVSTTSFWLPLDSAPVNLALPHALRTISGGTADNVSIGKKSHCDLSVLVTPSPDPILR